MPALFLPPYMYQRLLMTTWHCPYKASKSLQLDFVHNLFHVLESS
jgi:hypothetical protein